MINRVPSSPFLPVGGLVASSPQGGSAVNTDPTYKEPTSRTEAYQYLYPIGVASYRWPPGRQSESGEPVFPVRDARFFSDKALDAVAGLLQAIDSANERIIKEHDDARRNGHNPVRHIRAQLIQQLPAPVLASLSAFRPQRPPAYERTIADNNKHAFKLTQRLVAAIHQLMQLAKKNGHNSEELQDAQVELESAIISIRAATMQF
jgi:hypothetical protein